MTFEDRMAELGVDLSDLPTRYEVEHRSAAFDAADNFGGSLSMTHNFTDYILHLTDVIDRMETRIVNLTGERDYLIGMYGFDCEECKRYDECNHDGDYCERDLVENWAGVPEDWRAE